MNKILLILSVLMLAQNSFATDCSLAVFKRGMCNQTLTEENLEKISRIMVKKGYVVVADEKAAKFKLDVHLSVDCTWDTPPYSWYQTVFRNEPEYTIDFKGPGVDIYKADDDRRDGFIVGIQEREKSRLYRAVRKLPNCEQE